MSFKTIRDLDARGKIILLRGDLNVPAKNGVVSDTTRIDRLKPTIDALVEKGAKIVLMSHFGRPKNGPDDEFSMRFMPNILKAQWGYDIQFAPDCIGEETQSAIAALKDGQIILLENLRFYPGEEKNDAGFVKSLSVLGDIYVNDAFATAHRAHASTEGLAHILPTYAGFLMEAELNALNAALENPQRPLAAIVGGAKISTKIDLLMNLVTRADILVLGGGMANTFLHAKGVDLKASLCEKDMADQARAIMDTAAKHKCRILLPLDGVWADQFADGTPHGTCPIESVPEGKMVLDIGAHSIDALKSELESAKTIVWNGPLGAFEISPFDAGTKELAKFVAEKTRSGDIISVAGGGDTVSALEQAGCIEDLTYVSTAGGAFLEWLEGKTLPGVAALEAAAKKAA